MYYANLELIEPRTEPTSGEPTEPSSQQINDRRTDLMLEKILDEPDLRFLNLMCVSELIF